MFQEGIDILIGGDLLDSILVMESKTGAPGTATAYNTIFGWTILAIMGFIRKTQHTHQYSEVSQNRRMVTTSFRDSGSKRRLNLLSLPLVQRNYWSKSIIQAIYLTILFLQVLSEIAHQTGLPSFGRQQNSGTAEVQSQ